MKEIKKGKVRHDTANKLGQINYMNYKVNRLPDLQAQADASQMKTKYPKKTAGQMINNMSVNLMCN